MRTWLVLGLFAVAGSALGQLTEVERKGLVDTLFIGNMNLKDLDFARRPYEGPFRLPLVNLSIDNPLEASTRLFDIHTKAGKAGASELISMASAELGFTAGSAVVAPSSADVFPLELPKELVEPIRRLGIAVALANAFVRTAQAKLKPTEVRILIESLPQWAVEEPSIKFEFVKGAMTPPRELLEIVGRLDLGAMVAGGKALAASVEREMTGLKQLVSNMKWEGLLKFQIAGMVTIVAGVGDNVHRDRDARLVIDLGGNDSYYGRAGAGPGHAALSVDLGGNDQYKLPDVGAGCGLVGIGLAYDFGGHDNFRGGSLCFGVGIAGVGAFFKEGGDDSYQSATMSQGFGCFGIGLLIDTRGNDLYKLELLGQGAAKTMGWGQLVDRVGDDTYRAGGLVLNSPLFTNVHYSNAQGYASGYREDTGGLGGGIGLITDAGGDDAYIGETYCQAASYWFALGSLYDAAGKDTYNAYHYAQASAMHMCGAYLFDLAGDDAYMTNFGASHAIGHDYGVAFLLDRQGSDIYAGRDSSPGTGNANGLGIFIDAAGDDRYSGPAGVGNPARNSGSLGVFVDLAGQDQYRTGLEDSEAAYREQWGVAYDVETKPALEVGTQAGPPPPPVGSVARPTDEALEKLYQRATQWNVGSAQGDVKLAMNQLIGIGMPAMTWMIEKRLPAASRLEQRAFVDLMSAIGEPAKTAIYVVIAGPDDAASNVAMMICIDGSAMEAGPSVALAIKLPKRQRVASRAAGLLGGSGAVDDLVALAEGPDRLTALNAIISLGLLGETKGVALASKLLESNELPIRRAAIGVLAKSPDGLVIGGSLAAGSTEQNVRTGIDLLSAIGSQEALNQVGAKLTDERPGVRISALIALNGRAPEIYRQAVLDCRRDPDARVRAVALRIDPGR